MASLTPVVQEENGNPNTIAPQSASKKSFSANKTLSPIKESITKETRITSSFGEEDRECTSSEATDEADEHEEQIRHHLQEEQRLEKELRDMECLVDDKDRFVAYLQKSQNKELALKDGEIAELKRKVQKAKDEEDAAKVEAQKERIKREANHKAEVEQLKADLRAKEGNNPDGNTGRSFSMKSFSTMFQSGKSQKLQAKVQANAAERDHVRQVKSLTDELAKVKALNWKLERESEVFQEMSAQTVMEMMTLKQHIEFLEGKLMEGKAKYKKMQQKNQEFKNERESLILKAGWAAEQVHQLTGDLEYERSKHIKTSRLQQVKMVEELQRLKKEVEELRKGGGSQQQQQQLPKAGVEKKASTSAKTSTTTVSSTPPVVVVPEPVLLGNETIAELVQMKAKQREQRDVKTEALLKKHQQENERAKREEISSKEDTMGKMCEKAVLNRRRLMNEDSVLEDNEEDWD